MTFTISPKDFDAVIFDMDGVLTQTANLHAEAWGTLFNEYLEKKSGLDSCHYAPFDPQQDYLEYVDGKARVDGIQSFLESRGLSLPFGSASDALEMETVSGFGNRKNQLFHQLLTERGLELYDTTISFIHELKAAGVKVALISASKNCVMILEKTGLTTLFDAKVDGVDAERLGLKGKPMPDVFLEAARQLNVLPHQAAIVEDAVSGVQAGKAGQFKLVIGVDRGYNADSLKANGADWVITDLGELTLLKQNEPFKVGDVFETASDLTDFSGVDQSPWQLIYTDFDPVRERQRESLRALGNGYLITRGAAAEATDDGIHYPGNYFAGLYNRLKTDVAGEVLENDDLVNAPNWLTLTFRCNQSDWFALKDVKVLDYKKRLDLKKGILYSIIRFEQPNGEISRIEERRLVHMRYFHLAALEFRITPENWSGLLEIKAALDGRVQNNNVKHYEYLNKQHWHPLEACVDDHGFMFLRMKTNQSHIELAQAARLRFYQLNAENTPDYRCNSIEELNYVEKIFQVEAVQNQTMVLEKVVSQFTSRDQAMSDCGEACRLELLKAESFESLAKSQILAWKHLWRLFDIEIEANDDREQEVATELILHLHIFHLLQTVSEHSIQLDIGIPARGWHGEGYRGHIFWDDIFIFPFLNFRMPALTRSLLKYRYRRLEQARSQAVQAGYRGAMFPWQSSSDGREETPTQFYNPRSGRWMDDNSHLQRHINSSVVHNVWQYYQASGDIEFLVGYGAEMVLEIARFWASASTYDPAQGRYEIKGVMGPDEYHDGYPGADKPGLNNNAYTNIFAVWVFCRALDILKILPTLYKEQIVEKIGLTQEEIVTWEDISRKMKIEIQENGIISQFEGYDQLEEFDWDGYREKYGSLYRLDLIMESEGKRMNQYKASKQADLLMLFFLFSAEELQELFERLGYEFSEEAIPRNIDYYLQRTSHGSTLCRVAHAWVLSRSNRAHSWQLFRESLLSDVADIQGGTTSEGIHMAAMAGTVDIIQRCYTGMVARNDVLWFNPCLPEPLQRMRLNLDYRQQLLQVELTHQYLSIKSCVKTKAPVQIGFQNQVYSLAGCETLKFDLTATP
ncbi:beta-phosphoglucomutase family hydrolase [Vampirovibrio sp.]|uniref:beta-phosphoglucomutase family hydrolase n=1 Tax=Vampirovibrio sp. TaxID=2717857 RepID=UPI003593D1A4